MSDVPKRIQLRRTKGWRKPEGAIFVARPSKWGNPFKVADCRVSWVEDEAQARKVCVEAFSDCVRYGYLGSWWPSSQDAQRHLRRIAEEVEDLRGHDLACWCPLETPDGSRAPCHADVLLELANPEVVFPWSK